MGKVNHRTHVNRFAGATGYPSPLYQLRELTRSPDKKQAARVAAKIVKEVERSEKEAAKNPGAKPHRPELIETEARQAV